MEITQTFHAPNRQAWRKWLRDHHEATTEIWLVLRKNDADVTYLEAVEEALCFGWIDGIAKKLPDGGLAQRFTPRRPRSHWTELNKERARRLIREKRMTSAGRAVLPSLDTGDFRVAPGLWQVVVSSAPEEPQHRRQPEPQAACSTTSRQSVNARSPVAGGDDGGERERYSGPGAADS